MSESVFEFVDLDNHESFLRLGKRLGGEFNNGCFLFNNNTVCGEISKASPENNLCVRKSKLTLSEQIVLRKLPPPANSEKKFCLLYFLNPSIFLLKKYKRGMTIAGHRSNLFFSSKASMDFSVLPKQPFYALDIAFTASWLNNQFEDAPASFKEALQQFIHCADKDIRLESCSAEEYKTLREFELFMNTKERNGLFIRSRVYKLITEFFCKVFDPNSFIKGRRTILYDQVMEAEKLIVANLGQLPNIRRIAQQVNLSTSSLRRQFRLVFEKGIEEYYIARKMELAKNLLLQNRFSIKEVARSCGYKQTSAFIEMFSRLYGYSPGTLKAWQNEIRSYS